MKIILYQFIISMLLIACNTPNDPTNFSPRKLNNQELSYSYKQAVYDKTQLEKNENELERSILKNLKLEDLVFIENGKRKNIMEEMTESPNLKKIIQSHFHTQEIELYFDFKDEYLPINFSNEVTQKIIRKHKDKVIENPKSYTYLNAIMDYEKFLEQQKARERDIQLEDLYYYKNGQYKRLFYYQIDYIFEYRSVEEIIKDYFQSDEKIFFFDGMEYLPLN